MDPEIPKFEVLKYFNLSQQISNFKKCSCLIIETDSDESRRGLYTSYALVKIIEVIGKVR